MISAEQMCRVPAWFTGKGTDADVVMSTRVRLARNLHTYRFPGRASLEERKAVFEKVSDACTSLSQCNGFAVTNFAPLRKMSQRFLMEERAVSPEMVDAEGDRGLVGEADHRVGVLINEEDHIRLQAMDAGLNTECLVAMLDDLDTSLGQHVRYAYERRRGYLTACPTNAGTGLRVSFLLHLPGLALTKTIDQVLQAASQMSMATRGFFGEHSEIVGTLFQLSNQATMGATEAEFVRSTEGLVRHVIGLEREARQRLLREARTELTDKVHRSYGILRYARALSVSEFLNLSSALRTGVDCGLLNGLSTLDINRLTLLIMPAHIQTLYDKTMDEDELAVMRAEIVRSLLKQKIEDL
jgi:protein arginine kinase